MTVDQQRQCPKAVCFLSSIDPREKQPFTELVKHLNRDLEEKGKDSGSSFSDSYTLIQFICKRL